MIRCGRWGAWTAMRSERRGCKAPPTQVLAFRDSVMKKISNTIDKIPGLGALVEKLTNSINVFVFTTLEPCEPRLCSSVAPSS